MKKSEMLIGLGFKPTGDESEDDDSEMTEDEDHESSVDEAIDVFLDDKEDMDVRREAFRRAVKGCQEY